MKNSIFCHFFVDNFFLHEVFFTTFSKDSKSGSNSMFLIPISHLWNVIILALFYKLWWQTRTQRMKKTEKLFYKCVSELNFATDWENQVFKKNFTLMCTWYTVACALTERILRQVKQMVHRSTVPTTYTVDASLCSYEIYSCMGAAMLW